MSGLALAGVAGGGAILGGIGGALNSNAEEAALRKQIAYFKSLSPKLQEQYGDQINAIEGALNTRVTQAGGEEAVQNYYGLVEGYDPNKFTYKPEDFNYAKNINDFQDPGAQYRMDAARRQTEASLAGQGNLFSGGAGRQLMAESQELASQEYDKSYTRMYNDKQSAYQQYRDKVADTRASLDQQEKGYLNKIGFANQNKNDVYTAEDLSTTRKLTAQEQYQQNNMNLGNTVAGLQAQKDSISTTGAVLQGMAGGATAGSNVYSAFTGK